MRNNNKPCSCASFGELIRQRRKLKGWSIEQLAESCDRSDREVRDIELGNSEPLLGTALLLCRACNIKVGELEEFIPIIEVFYV